MKRYPLFAAVLIAAILALGACAVPTPPLPTASPTDTPPPTVGAINTLPSTAEATAEPTPPTVDRVHIYLIALEDGGHSGPAVGCGDSAVAVEVPVEPTTAPLEAALTALLSIKDQFYGQSGLYNALSLSDLSVAQAVIEDGVATVELVGTMMLGGVCDNPRVEAQLMQTALQFPTVSEVHVFVNGTPLEEVLSLK